MRYTTDTWPRGRRYGVATGREPGPFRVGDVRLTSVVFQAQPSLHQVLSDAHAAQRWGARRERIGSRVLTYRNVQGYTVPFIEHDGVVYAFTGDLEQNRLLKLVADAQLP